jgi:hypothetical protein
MNPRPSGTGTLSSRMGTALESLFPAQRVATQAMVMSPVGMAPVRFGNCRVQPLPRLV